MGLTPNRLARRMSRASARIGPWPRRLAAVLCLLLAAGSALAPPPAHRVHPAVGASRLRPGQVALPVPVPAAGVELVRPGVLIGLLSQRRLVADRLRVLAVRAPDQSVSGDASAVVVVAVDRPQAGQIAASAGHLALIVDELP